MKDNILCIFIMLFVSVTFNANAQKSPQGQFSVKGVLVDSLSNEGEPYSTIRISLKSNPAKPVKLAVTDTNGKFSERLVSPGTYLISFSSVGKRTVQKEFTVSDTKKVADLGHIQMAEATEMLKGVEVVAQKPLVKAEIDKVTYSIEDDPDSKTNSTLEMLRKVPLVTVDGEDKIQVNGSSNFKVHVNGKPNNPTEVLKSLPANSVKSIEVITDPGAKYDAEGVGGILNIITTGGGMEGYTVTLNGGVSNRGYNASGYGTVQIGKFTVTGNYAYNHNTSPRSYSSSGREDFTSDDYKYLSSESSSKHKGNFQYGSMEGSYEIDTLNLITFSMNMFGGKFKNNGYGSTNMLNAQKEHAYSYNTLSRNESEWASVGFNFDYQRSFKKKGEFLTFSYRYNGSPDNSEAYTEYEEVRLYFLNAQAGFLAAELEPGKPCPVCGSIEHPHPAKKDVESVDISEEKLQNMIFEKFLGQCPSEEEMAQIKSVDDAMLFHEFKCFMNEELDIPEHEILTRPAFSTKPFEDVEEDFLLMFHKISALL